MQPPAARRAWLDPDGAAAQAREFTRHVMRSWGLTMLAEDATLIVSELVTNAVQHGAGQAGEAPPAGIELVLCRRAGLMACAVIDPGAEPPLLVPADFAAETGRGLHVVDALSAGWGWTRLGGRRKAVWATLRAPCADAAKPGRERPALALCWLEGRPPLRSAMVRCRGQAEPDRYQSPPGAAAHRAARGRAAGPRPAVRGLRA